MSINKTITNHPTNSVKNILVLHGPNLNLLGSHGPNACRHVTLAEVNAHLTALANKNDINLSCFQSNAEAGLVERIQKAHTDGTQFIIINPAAFTHTSIMLRDALSAVAIPFMEVHFSNMFSNELFRKESFFSSLAVGVISGLGVTGYEFAVQFALNYKESL
jgi:3-dehydroquinate dehydratase-2